MYVVIKGPNKSKLQVSLYTFGGRLMYSEGNAKKPDLWIDQKGRILISKPACVEGKMELGPCELFGMGLGDFELRDVNGAPIPHVTHMRM